jgi:hypothetical protein
MELELGPAGAVRAEFLLGPQPAAKPAPSSPMIEICGMRASSTCATSRGADRTRCCPQDPKCGMLVEMQAEIDDKRLA